MTEPNQPDQAQQPARWVKLDDIVEADNNPREHDLPYIANLIRRFGFLVFLVEDTRTGKLVMGHGRLAALRWMREKGETAPLNIQDVGDDWAAPVVSVETRDDDHATTLQVADNRAPEKSRWNPDALLEMLSDLAASEDPDLLALSGYDSEAMDDIMAAAAEQTPELPPTPPAPDLGGGYSDSGWDDEPRSKSAPTEDWSASNGGSQTDYRDEDEKALDDKPEPEAKRGQPAWRTIHPPLARFHTGGLSGGMAVREFLGGQPVIEPEGTVRYVDGITVPPGCWVVKDGQTGRATLYTDSEFRDRYTAANEDARRHDTEAREATVLHASAETVHAANATTDGPPQQFLDTMESMWRMPGEISFSDVGDDDAPEEDDPPGEPD